MKRGRNINLLFGLFAIFLILSNLAVAQSDILWGVDSNLNPQDISTDSIKEKGQEKWDYLQKEWKNILLKNNIIAKLDSFFTKINILFVILLGEDYSLTSFKLFLIVILWIIIAIGIGNLLKARFGLSIIVSYLIGIGLSVILAQLRIYSLVITATLKIAFAPELWWVRLIIWGVIFFVLILISYVFKILSGYLKKDREKQIKSETNHLRNVLDSFMRGSELKR
ncbi:MAG: hypothetical protein AABX03_01765 [Nanoarchaeota archaeon]